MTRLEILGIPQSTFVRTTRIALEEKGVPYDLTIARPQSPEILSVHPFGKVPAMRHGDFELFESRAIIAYADRVFDGPKLAPEDPRIAAAAEQWASAIAMSVFPNSFPYMREFAFPSGPDGAFDTAVIAAHWPAARANIAILDAALDGKPYLAGASFTLADMYALPVLAYLSGFPQSGAMMRDSENLSGYMTRCTARPSFGATVPPPMNQLRN
ncbi:MAG TPA: glutathione S-transferase family protein [Rhizomicrobium sp.]|jgi:glutathione S-transferase|nr:glutathione S-transferase family protein [Rhizomicrobium sp.]